jgi:sortase A
MRASPGRRVVSYLFVAAGSFLLFLGTREFIESQYGQTEAAREFDALPAASAPANVPPETPASDAASPAAFPTVTANGTVPPSKPIPAPRPGDAIAKLMIPRLDAELYVVEGDGARELRRGPGHLTGTAFPGENGNCVIAGHRDTHFRMLKDVHAGDDIVVKTAAGQFLYRVKNTRVVSPTDTTALQPTPDAELNLVTCYPFYYVGAAPKRYVVEAELAGAVPADASTAAAPAGNSTW